MSAITYGYEPTNFESSASSQFKWHQPQPRSAAAPADTRSAHFSLGDDAVSWDTATRSTYGAHAGHERVKPVKPTGGPAIMFGNEKVDYSSVAAKSYAGGPITRDASDARAREDALKDRHTRHFVLGDDAPVYESETMSQARGGVSTTDKTGPAPRKPPTPTSAATRSGPSAIMFGNSTPEYTTTTGSSMVNYNVSAPQRQTKPAQAAIVFGDDSVDFVSNRMAEEGLMSRKLGQRYDPKATVGGDKTGAPVRASVDKPALAGVSWKLGTDEWKPQTSAAADFAWPTMESTSGPRQSRVVVRSNIHLGDDGSAFVTEAKGSYSQPDATLGGRQPSARPLGGGAIVFGSDSVSYKSAAAAAHGDVHMDGSATVERLAAMQRGLQKNIVFGDDSSAWESSAQSSAKGYLDSTGTMASRPERIKGTSAASFVLGNAATEYVTTTGAASSAIGASKTTPRAEKSALVSAGPAIVFGDDRVEYVTTTMAHTGTETKVIGQRYQPRGIAAK